MGDLDVGAPLRAEGIPVTVLCRPSAETRHSRYYERWLTDPRPDEEALAQTLLQYARGLPGRAALYYQTDADLLFVSRQRQRLSEEFAFVIPEAELVEQITDKSAFHDLGERLSLPVPQTVVLELTGSSRDIADIEFPVLVKPVLRERAWEVAFDEKAILVECADALDRLLEALRPEHSRILVQQFIPGPETQVESYHVYVDASGDVAAEFTGRKLRTFPSARGYSTAVTTSDIRDVAQVGREVVEKLQLRGVAKVDFKRDPKGRLWLLEINPRFNLWHHAGAAAGVNIPAIVWADLMGLGRPPSVPARAGVVWCDVARDWSAARSSGVGTLAWLRWLATCEAWSSLNLSDPMPIAAKLLSTARRHARRLVPIGRRR
jgi:predicted ATP-grasp superfamily ATP-dependent carboligase